ncbi:BZ3500_MvSof-1268-A1-R1_C065g00314 [Microbotryum saponariae]|uniref:BZ3500_MvSof-1268-A1-R1_C065g00314 protein n=1 Tax=Microbotryum saponariae TaxID=289078 RepID=A0A2X0LAQ5_9BASI|nr:BZ3500_MvSof-1268-A1-R1_C065g00314 [Microbotryum saponariae]
MTPEGCSDDVDSNADSDPAVDDSEASSSDGGEEAMDRLRQVVNLLENCAPNHLQLEYDTMQAKRQAIMSSNLLWSAEEKADYGQWPLILGDRRKADEWTLKDTIPILKLPLYMATEEAKLTKFFLTDPPPILHWRNQPEQEHEWTACKYERCLAVVETSHGAPSISFHQHPADHLTLIEWHPLIGHNLQSTWKESLKEVLRISHQCSGACNSECGSQANSGESSGHLGDGDGSEPRIVDMRLPKCKCADFDQSGKRCPHLWAVDLLVNNGPYHTVMNTARAAMDLKGALHDDIPRSKVRDSTIEMVVNCAINENIAIDDLHGSLSEEDASGESEADESEAEIDIGNRAGVAMKAATSRGPSPKNKPLQPGRSIKKPKGRSKKKTRLNVTENVQGATSPTIKSAPHLEHTGRRNGHADKLLKSLLRDKLNPASLRTKTAKDKPFADEAFSKTRGRRPETKPSNSLIGTKHHQAAKEITDYLTTLECLDIACSDEALSDDQKPACPCPPLVEGMLEPSIYATVDPDDRMASVTNIQGVVVSIKHPYTASRQDRFPWMIHLDVHQNAYVPGLNLRTLATLNDPEEWVSSAHIDAFVTAINRFGGQAAMREDQRSAASDWTPTVYGFHPLKDFGEDIGGKNPTNRHPGTPALLFPIHMPGHWVLVEARLFDHTFRFYDSLRRSKESVDNPNISSPEQNFANCLKNIVPFLTARAEGPIPRVTGGSDRPTIPYAEWERVIVKPRVPKKGDLMPRTEFTRQPDGNACGVFVCRTIGTLVAAVAFQSELDWSWSPLKPLQDNFYADQRTYMLDVVIHARLRCDTELEANSDPPPLDLRGGLELLRRFQVKSVPLALKESSPELEEKPLGSPGIEFCAPTLVLIDPSIGTMYTSEPNPDAQCTSPLISRSPRPNPAPSIATIGSMPDAPPMRLPRVVRFDPTPPLLVSEALEVVACLPRYQTRTLAVRSIAAISKSAPSPRRSKRKREESFFKAARLR